MQITTLDHIPGQAWEEMGAPLFSEQVQAVNAAKDLVGGIKAMFGGAVRAYSQEYQRARAAARQASLALLVLDGSTPLTDADREAMDLARQAPNLLVAVNKSDLPRAVDIGRLADEFDNVVSLSARSGEGVSVLCDAIGAMYPAGEGRPGELLTNARQADAVSRALASVRSARSALRIGMTPDVVLTDAEAALEALGELNGKHIRDDLIQTIFSRFCVGK